MEWSLNPEIKRHLFLLWGSPHCRPFSLPDGTQSFRPLCLQFQISRVSVGRFVSVLAESVGFQLSAASAPHQGSEQATPIQCLTASSGPSLAPQPWFPDLLDLSVGHPRQLLVMETLLKQPRSDRFHLDLGRLQLHAWRLSGDLLKRPDFPGIQQRELQPPRLHPQSRSMKKNGTFSVFGVVDRKQILSLLLFP